MTGKAQDAEFRHPEAVARLQGLTDEEAARRLALVREHDGVATRQRREGGRVHCREVAAEASVGSSSEMEAVHATAEAEFGCSLPHLRSQRGPNALRPLLGSWTAGRIRRRGKRLQANRRQPLQASRMPLVEGRSQRPARRQMLPRKQALGRLPRLATIPYALMVQLRCICGAKIVHATQNLRISRSSCRFDLWNPAF